MKISNATLILISAFSLQAFAGASNAQLDCKSADGKTRLTGDVPGDFTEFNVTATASGKNGGLRVTLFAKTNQQNGQFEESGRITVIDDLENGVYTLNADDKAEGMQRIRLYAIPKTVKSRKTGNVGFEAKFLGRLNISSENGGNDSTVACTVSYSI